MNQLPNPRCLLGAAAAALLATMMAMPLVVPAAAEADLPPVVHSIPAERLQIPAIGVDAPVVEVGYTAEGAMASPDGPYAVGWYPFSPTPGNPGNTVLSGHRDWRTGVTAVFWRLGELAPGDAVSVQLADGSSVDYRVVLSVLLAPDQMPIDEVVGPTREETITLITCEGSFDRASRDYDKRRVVWATRAS